MGNGCSCNCDWIKDAWDKFQGFFKGIAEWFEGVAKYIWGDLTFAYYVSRDLILVIGPFLGFFLYVMLTRAEVIVG